MDAASRARATEQVRELWEAMAAVESGLAAQLERADRSDAPVAAMRVQFAGCSKAEHDMRELIAAIEKKALLTPQNYRVAAGSAASSVCGR